MFGKLFTENSLGFVILVAVQHLIRSDPSTLRFSVNMLSCATLNVKVFNKIMLFAALVHIYRKYTLEK